MGRDKARLPFRGGELAGAVARAVAEAAGSATFVGHPVLPGLADRYPGEGPLGGILTALQHTTTEGNLIVACDMPGLSGVFLSHLVARADARPGTVILPHGPDGRAQPLCAVYPLSALATLQRHFERGVRRVETALEGLAVEPLAIAELSYFQNVNTPGDWAAYEPD